MAENERRPQWSDLEDPGILMGAKIGGLVMPASEGVPGTEYYIIEVQIARVGATTTSEWVQTIVVPRDKFQPLLESLQEASRTIPPRLFS